MRHHRHRTKALCTALAALTAASANVNAAADFLESRPGIPDAVLASMRGGISAAATYWSFSVVRTVSVNGTVVLTQQLRIADLAPLIQTGTLPQVTTIMPGAGVVLGTGNSLTDAVAGRTIGNSDVMPQASVPQTVAVPPPASTAPQAMSAGTTQTPASQSTQQTSPAPQVATALPVAAPAASAPAAAPATSVPAAAPAASAPAGARAGSGALAAPTTPLVVHVPNGNGTIQAIVIDLPNRGTILQNTLNSVNLGVATQMDVSAQVLDAARSGVLRQQILDSLNLPRR